MTYSDTKFEVSTSGCLEDALTIKDIVRLLTLTFGSRSLELFTSNLSLRLPYQLLSLKLLRLTVLEIMHLQENTLFDP